MAKGKSKRPTDTELLILSVLWDRGSATVREVHESIERARSTGYTTVLKLMQIMHEKGLVDRDETERSHRYSARESQVKTQRRLVKDLAERAFGGSLERLVMQAISSKPVSPEELAQIREFLDTQGGGDS